MNRCSSPGSIAVGGIKSISMWNLHHHHYYYYCKSGPGCCVQGERRVRYVSGDGPYFYFTWKSGLMAFHLFSFIGAYKQEPLKTLSCYDQSLWTLLGLSPLSWCGSLWSPGCLLTDHRVEVCCLCGFKSDYLRSWKLLLMFSTVY